MTRTRATPVPKSRISGRADHHSTTRGRGSRPARSVGRGAGLLAGGRWLPPIAVPAAEKAEEVPLGGQHERGVLAVKRVAIGLQRAVEGKELLVLPECLGIDLDRLRVAVAA